MKILLVYPDYEETFWSFKKVLKILGKKAAYPPLGLLTVGAMLPGSWEKKLVDMNTDILKDEYIKWADYIFISAMIVQKESTRRTINKIKRFKKPIVAGGPLFTTGWEEFTDVDHIFLGEVENTFSEFVRDLGKGTLRKIYSGDEFPNIEKTAIPDWNSINTKNYNSLCVQLSRGCPFNCEFCDVVQLNGRIPRLKSKEQLMELMVQAGFTAVFIGIETPDAGGLEECGKVQNKNRNLIESVKIIQNAGMEGQGGFIVGFDSDN